MNPQQIIHSNLRGNKSIAVLKKNPGIRPAGLFELVSDPPVLLYSSPAIGMVLLIVTVASFYLSSFFKTISNLFTW